VDRPQRLAKRHEQRSADFYGARLTPASGSGTSKGDAASGTELFEFKHTERQSFGLRFRDFSNHHLHALQAGLRAIMEVEYTDPNGLHPHYLLVMTRDDYVAMRDELNELREGHCGEGCTGYGCTFCERT
jgi:hypothetical protein